MKNYVIIDWLFFFSFLSQHPAFYAETSLDHAYLGKMRHCAMPANTPLGSANPS